MKSIKLIISILLLVINQEYVAAQKTIGCLWGNYQGQYKFSEKWGMQLEASMRGKSYNEGIIVQNMQMAYRIGLNYAISKKWEFAFGVGLRHKNLYFPLETISTDSSKLGGYNFNIDDYLIWQQFQYKQNFAADHIIINPRLRVEELWTSGDSLVGSGYSYTRGRLGVRADFFIGNLDKKIIPYFAINEEFIVRFEKAFEKKKFIGPSENFVEQLRSQFNVGLKINHATQIELGYMHAYDFSWYTTHIGQLTIIQNLKFYKEKKKKK